MNPLEIELVRSARTGDRDAFEQIFLLEKEYLYKCAFLYTKNQDDALDLVQSCIVKCMVHIRELKEPERFRTWMTRILINCANSESARRQKYELRREEDLPEELPRNDTAELSAEERMDLYRAIDRLDFPYREIVIQYYFARSKLSEIAEILDMPVGTIKAYHAKAKVKLRKLLEVKI